MKLPLEGFKVLDLSRALAGPFCTMILADLGAEVIKVEPSPEGEMIRQWGPFKDGISVYYLSVHRNKKSLVVNFRDPAGLNLIRNLVSKVDIVVENFKPGVMKSMGMAYEDLKKFNPRLIFSSISGLGRGGPYEDWPGVDQIAQGMSGLMSLTGKKESGPVRVGIPIGDVVAGMWSAMAIQAALIQRHSTGLGQLVETSLLASLIGMLNVQGQRHLTLGETPGVVGNDHPVICPYGVFEASDGPFNLAATSDDMFVKLCSLINLPEMATDERFINNTARMKNRDDLKKILNAKFISRKKMEWTLDLVKLGLPAGPIFDLEQVFADPHINQSGMIEEVDHPELGRLRLLANPIRMQALNGNSVRTAPPILGADTKAVLSNFGLLDSEINQLIENKIIQQI